MEEKCSVSCPCRHWVVCQLLEDNVPVRLLGTSEVASKTNVESVHCCKCDSTATCNQGGCWISMHEVILHSLVRVGRLMMVPQVKLTAVSGPLCPMRCHQLSHCQSVVFMPASHYQLATQSFSFSRSHHLTSPVTVSNYSTPYCVALLCNNRQPRLVGSDRATHWGCYYILLPSQTEGNEKDKTEVYY